jgi:POT family proton-dependent oligopeptide transporter
METSPKTTSQSRSFTTIFLIEMWERFGFYGMQALIVYYMVQRLGFPDERATLVWGAAAALIYVAPAIGGWIGDKVLGTRRTMLLGALVLTIGYTLMVIPGQSIWFLLSATVCSRPMPATWCVRFTRVTIPGSTAPSPFTTWRSTWAR